MGRFFDFLIRWGEAVYKYNEETLNEKYKLQGYIIKETSTTGSKQV